MEEMRRSCDWQRHSSGFFLNTAGRFGRHSLGNWKQAVHLQNSGRRRCVARATSGAMEGADLVDWIIMQFASSCPAHLSDAGSGPVTFPSTEMPKRMRQRLRDINRFKRRRVAPCHIFYIATSFPFLAASGLSGTWQRRCPWGCRWIWASHLSQYMDLS